MIMKFSISNFGALLVAIAASFLFSQPLLAIDAEIEQAVVSGDWQKVAQFFESKDLNKNPVAAKLSIVSCFATNCEKMLLTSLMQTPNDSTQNDFSIWCKAMREKNPESANVAFVSGVANLSPTSIDSALLYFDRAIELDSQYALVQAVKGFAHLLFKNDLESAQKNFAYSVALDSYLALGHLGYGMTHLYSSENGKAITEFDYALTIEPKFLDARLCKGVALVHLDRPDDAKSLFDEMVCEDYSALHKLYAARGDLLSVQGLHRSAIWDYTTALAHFNPRIEEFIFTDGLPKANSTPQSAGGYVRRELPNRYFGEYVNAIFSRGYSYREIGNHDSALADFSRAFKILHKREKSMSRISSMFNVKLGSKIDFIARIQLYRGMTYIELGDFKKANKDFSDVIKRYPQNSYAYYWKGLALKERGSKKRAVKAFEGFLERATASDSILVAKAKTHIAEIEKK